MALVVALAAALSSPGGSASATGPLAGLAGHRTDGSRAAGVAAALPLRTAPGPVPGASASGPRVPAAAQGVPAGGQGVVAGPRVVARAAVVADESTGQVLFERDVGAARAMASTTKVMTALLALERLDERRVVVIGPGPPHVGEESLRLRKGERLTVRQLLLGLLVKSANDAAVALAEAVDGSEAAFVRRMNRKAAALRLGATHYVTPYGLDRPGHQTSARDLARLWEVAMRRADFRALVATRAARLPGGPLSLRRFVTTNELLGSYPWTVGGKTGFTNQAGRCLVASASRGGRRLVAVALGSTDAFADVRALFEYGFSKFVRVRLARRGQPVSLAPDRPAAFQTGADVDALVRLDQLTRVRLLPAPGSGDSGKDSSAWFVAGGRRLVRVPLAGMATGAAPPTSVPVAPAPSIGATGTTGAAGIPGAGAAGAGAAAGSGGPAGAALVAGMTVRVWPVPPGAPAPAIDPLLRRPPP